MSKYAMMLAAIELTLFAQLFRKYKINPLDDDSMERFIFGASLEDFIKARAHFGGFIFMLNLAGILAWLP